MEGTLSGHFYFGAYWGARREDLEECAGRLLSFLSEIGTIDPMLLGWQERDGPAPTGQLIGREDVFHIVDAGRHENAALGFTLGLWNGQPAYPVGLLMTCGSHLGPQLGNAITVEFGTQDLCSTLDVEKAERVMRAMVAAWAPDWATLTTDDWRRKHQTVAGRPVAGWLTYFADRAPSRSLPEGAELVSVPPRGVIVKAADECGGDLDRRVEAIARVLESQPD